MHEIQLPAIQPDKYHAPASVQDALALLDEHGASARLVAGGTDLMLELDRRLGNPDIEVLVDLTRIPGLDTIDEVDGSIRLGPLVTHNQCATSEIIRTHGLALAQASLEVGSPALRNRATVAGNIVTASPANDTISALRALDASIEISSSSGQRTVTLADFHAGVRQTVLQPGDIVTAITFPLDRDSTSVFVKAGLRRAQAISVVHLAISCSVDPTDSTIRAARIALGSVAPTIVRSADAEAAIEGTVLDDGTIAAAARLAAESVNPIDDLRGSAKYRTDLVEVMVSRALEAIRDGQERDALHTAPLTLSGPNLEADALACSHEAGSVVTCTVNGGDTAAPWQPTSLLDWLRDQAHLPGTKEGCAEGECGACTVHLDGVATLSCLVPAGRAHRSHITTIEGLGEPEGLHQLQQSFIDCAAVQCGYCIPGFLMAGDALLRERSNPSETDLKFGLSGNLCRCTGYYKIEQAFAGSRPESGRRTEAR